MEIKHYKTEEGDVPFQEWFDGLKDIETRARIIARLTRVQAGLLGQTNKVGSGVHWDDYKTRRRRGET